MLDGPLSPEEALQLATVFKAVADPARLRLLSLIPAQAEGEACNELTEPVELSQPTVSHHHKVLALYAVPSSPPAPSAKPPSGKARHGFAGGESVGAVLGLFHGGGEGQQDRARCRHQQ